MWFELRNLTQSADLYLVDLIGNELPWVSDRARSTADGVRNESIEYTLEAGTYHILVRFAAERGAANYHLRYSNNSAIRGRRIESAFDLGDLTDVAAVPTRDGQVNLTSNESCLFRHNYFRFKLTDTRRMWFELRNLTQNADLYLVDLIGDVLPWVSDRAFSEQDGVRNESIEYTLDAGTYHVLVKAEAQRGTAGYRLRYSNNSVIPGRRVESAFDLGDLTNVAAFRTRQGQVEIGANDPDLFRRSYYRFTMTGERRMRFELRNLTQDADLYLVDLIGDVLPWVSDRAFSEQDGVRNESIEYTLDAGTYHILVTAKELSTSSYELRYGPAG